MTAATTDVTALLAACRQFPDEDTPRLALADALTESGWEDAAAFIRDSIANTGQRRVRQTMARGYMRWLESLLMLPPNTTGDNPASGICGGESWDSFAWWEQRDNRRCELLISRGLPTHLNSTAPMFMERAAVLFTFPVSAVHLCDRKADRDNFTRDMGGDTLFGWNCSEYPQRFSTWEDYDSLHHVPRPLYNCLPVGAGRQYKGWYNSRAEADRALATAALAYGRSLVPEPVA